MVYCIAVGSHNSKNTEAIDFHRLILLLDGSSK